MAVQASSVLWLHNMTANKTIYVEFRRDYPHQAGTTTLYAVLRLNVSEAMTAIPLRLYGAVLKGAH